VRDSSGRNRYLREDTVTACDESTDEVRGEGIESNDRARHRRGRESREVVRSRVESRGSHSCI